MELTLMLLVVLAAGIKLINYGRWAGRQGNRRGMVGLYLMALCTFAIPCGVYIFNASR